MSGSAPRIGHSGLVTQSGGERVLVFLPGFLTPPKAYRSLLEPLARSGTEVHIPQLYRHDWRALSGRAGIAAEAAGAAELVARLADSGRPVWLAGHSRGGQAAWRAAAAAPVAGLVLVDPVDGDGRRPTPLTTAEKRAFEVEPVIVGAGIGGRCAPEGVNHRRFAATAAGCTHLVVQGCGHADMLDGRWLRLGRLICPGGADPVAARRTLTELLSLAVARELTREHTAALPMPVVWE